MSSPDLLRRFTPTPLTADLRMMQRSIRLETNSDTLRQQMLCALGGSANSGSIETEFLWRLVTEDSADSGGRWPDLQAFTDGALSVVNVEHAGFIAVDRDEREAVGFMAEDLVRDLSGFRQRFLPTLLTLTAPSLGLMPISAACLARSGSGVLVVEKQDHLKMAFDRWALGLEPRAEGIVFLEAADHGLQAWSEFWLASLRDETEQAFGDLSQAASPSASGIHGQIDGGSLVRCAPWSQPVSVVSCVFIEHEAGVRLPARLQPDEVLARLKTAIVVRGGKGSQSSEALICEAFARLRAYHLSSGTHPADVATLFRKLLGEHDLVEASS